MYAEVLFYKPGLALLYVVVIPPKKTFYSWPFKVEIKDHIV